MPMTKDLGPAALIASSEGAVVEPVLPTEVTGLGGAVFFPRNVSVEARRYWLTAFAASVASFS